MLPQCILQKNKIYQFTLEIEHNQLPYNNIHFETLKEYIQYGVGYPLKQNYIIYIIILLFIYIL